MKNKKLISMLVAVTLVAVVGVGATLAYFTDKDEAKNVITMGHVDIELDEPHFDKETDEAGNPVDDYDGAEDGKISNVVPGQVIPKDPTITVKEDSEDAYIRAKVEYKDLSEKQVAELTLNLKDGWTEGTDGYYYYNDIVKAGDEVILFEEVTIPKTWGNDVAGKTFEINVSAEAVQARNFDVDLITNDEGDITGWNMEADDVVEYTEAEEAELE